MSAQPTQIQPLRVQKGSNSTNSSPTKTAFVHTRPLSELSPMALRRNSPSFPRNSLSKHESPGSSPFNTSTNSSRVFWQGRDPNSPATENRSPFDGLSPTKRSSIENLKKASRVKNSSIFAREQENNYDPARPKILDGQPLRNSIQGNASAGKGFLRASTSSLQTSPTKIEPLSFHDLTTKPKESPVEPSIDFQPEFFNPIAALSPSKMSTSPTKSSLSRKTGAQARRSGFDPTTGIWEDEDVKEKSLPVGKVLRRHAKSVTFNEEPPQINEYEMATPDPSSVASGSREGSYDDFDDEEGDMSFERGSSFDPHDDSFDASLEDTDKTPVVMPEDWRFMSPDTANTELVDKSEDVFADDLGSPPPEARPGSGLARSQQLSVTSVDSNGQARPLPPLPRLDEPQQHDTRQNSLSATMERLSFSARALPAPPAATVISKEDIRRMSNGTLSFNDRMKLMTAAIEHVPLEEGTDEQRERRMRRADSKEISPPVHDAKNEDVSPVSPIGSDNTNTGQDTRISRHSILEQLRSPAEDLSRSNSQYSQPSQPAFDPDVPIPSREDPTQHFEDSYEDDSIIIKDEPVDNDDLYAIPDMYRKTSSQLDAEMEEGSQYSQNSIQPSLLNVDQGGQTPKAMTPVREPAETLSSGRVSLPDFMNFGQEKAFDFGLGQYMHHSPLGSKKDPEVVVRELEPAVGKLPDLAALRENIRHESERPLTPVEPLTPPRPVFAERAASVPTTPGTPSSVIHHAIERSVEPSNRSDHESLERTTSNSEESDSSVIHNEIKTEEDLEEELTPEREHVDEPVSQINTEPEKKRPEKRVSSLVQLDFPKVESLGSLEFGLEEEFDRVLEAQKRGYLMRQNTKIVVATERASHEEPRSAAAADSIAESLAVSEPQPNEIVNSSRKISQPTWTAEPWNSKRRRKSIRINEEQSTTSTAPPLPGQASALSSGLGAVAEDELAEEEAEELEDGAERGRLFVKVVGVKDLQLPFPQHEKTQFALTLDNGLHCVTTAWLDLARNAPIGQEFELVVLNDLEFQLTLQMKMEEPKPEPARAPSPVKAPTSPKKQSTLGRLFGSPKKKKESDIMPQPVQEPKRPVTPPSAYELVQGLVAKDGSFGRAYVSCSEYEKQAYGRPATVDVKCFNEWAMEEVSVGSHRSKRGAVQLRRRPPYEIGKLELQLLYVPKPKGVKDEDMPKSMNSAIRAMRDAEEKSRQVIEVREFQGHLSQQGGDCPYWRRRFFKLVGTKLTAYHETTHQPRATINLAKAAKLIDDQSNLKQKETSTKGGGRRKSGFADDEDGMMMVEEGFRIRFQNGETIDFYAGSPREKEEWMASLAQVVGRKDMATAGKSDKPAGWTDMVLRREKSLKAKQKPKKEPKAGGMPDGILPGTTPETAAQRETRVPSRDKELPPVRQQLEQRQSFQGPFTSGALPAQLQPTKAPLPQQVQLPISQASPDETSFLPQQQFIQAQQRLSGVERGQMLPPQSPQKNVRPAHGHARTESYTTDNTRSVNNSPVKQSAVPKAGREDRHRKTKSMWG